MAATPSDLTLENDEVHVWQADLGLGAAELDRLQWLLAPDEQARATKFHFEKDRNHYTAARGLLRLILGLYLSKRPESIQFLYSAYGKPSLSLSYDDLLEFNVSHSQGLALYAVSRCAPVGIDVEFIRPDLKWREIVEHYFSPFEVNALFQLPEEQQQQAFFRCWTRKEAYIKAKGQGLSIPLNQFDVSLAPNEPAALLRTPESQEASRWSLLDVSPCEPFAGALAICSRNPQVKYWQVPQGWVLSNRNLQD
jgi:4'-phosphopantetheinyl transferase